MITTILFDLDGVLVDACDWHYHSLNRALSSFGYPSINMEDHISIYNGLPTFIKLNMIGIPKDEAKKINEAKQEFTLDIISKNAKIMPEKIKLHKYLKFNNIQIGCVTNSIHKTAKEMLYRTGQLEFIDILVTNEDVSRNKPYPDCYNFAIEKLKISGSNVLCVEDSEKGIESVKNSMAKHLLIVKKCSDVNIYTIKEYLNV
jgi:HAD superfamily hydrolase (TIGR01509 family)